MLDLNKDIYILLYINLYNLDNIEKLDKMSLMEIEFSNGKKVNINMPTKTEMQITSIRQVKKDMINIQNFSLITIKMILILIKF